MNRVDDLDCRIIAILEENGRLRNTQVAEMLGLTEGAVRRRVDRLVADETIRIVAVSDPMKTGHTVVAILSLRVNPGQFDQVAMELEAMSEFRFIGQTIGSSDFVAEAWFRSMADLQEFVSRRLAAVHGITQIDTMTVTRMIRYAYDWGVGSRNGDTALPGAGS